MNNDTENQTVVENFKEALKAGLLPLVGTNDVNAVKKAIANQMNHLMDKGLILGPSSTPNVTQLWRKWSMGQKAKWWFYNRFPFIRNKSDRIREAIDEFNRINLETLRELSTDFYFEPRLYPEHLTPNPKQIYVTDIYVRSAMDCVSVGVTID